MHGTISTGLREMGNTQGNIATGVLREQQRFPYKGWYAVVVRQSREQESADGFRKADVSCYWPNFVRQVSRGVHYGVRRHRAIFSPIFPGLIFCPMADEELFLNALNSIPYVINMLRREEGLPAILRNSDIERIRQIEAGANLPPDVVPLHNFKIGQRVRFIDAGPFVDFVGKVTRLDNDGRICLEVYLMGRMVPVNGVLPSQIEAA